MTRPSRPTDGPERRPVTPMLNSMADGKLTFLPSNLWPRSTKWLSQNIRTVQSTTAGWKRATVQPTQSPSHPQQSPQVELGCVDCSGVPIRIPSRLQRVWYLQTDWIPRSPSCIHATSYIGSRAPRKTCPLVPVAPRESSPASSRVVSTDFEEAEFERTMSRLAVFLLPPQIFWFSWCVP